MSQEIKNRINGFIEYFNKQHKLIIGIDNSTETMVLDFLYHTSNH